MPFGSTPCSRTHLKIGKKRKLHIISGSFDCAYLSSSVRVPWLSFGAVVVIVAVSKVELFEVTSLSKNRRTVDCGSHDQPSSKSLADSPHLDHRLVFSWQIRRRSIILEARLRIGNCLALMTIG